MKTAARNRWTNMVSVSLFRPEYPKKHVEGIENSRFKMGPEGNAAENVGVPERDGMVLVNLVKEETLVAKVAGNEIRPEKQVIEKDDFPKQEETKSQQKGADEDILPAYSTRGIHNRCPRRGEGAVIGSPSAGTFCRCFLKGSSTCHKNINLTLRDDPQNNFHIPQWQLLPMSREGRFTFDVSISHKR